MGGELAVLIVEQVAWWFVVNEAQVAELLGGPRAVRGVGEVLEDDPTTADPDEKQVSPRKSPSALEVRDCSPSAEDGLVRAFGTDAV